MGGVLTVTGISYITALNIAQGTQDKAPEGKGLNMMVKGIETSVKAGTYKGKIVIKVS